jgi:tetratricopeptide (TPR) repeat protein
MPSVPPPPDLGETAREIVQCIVQRRSSMRSTGVLCGRSQMWVWRQLRQNKGIDLAKFAKVLDLFEVPLLFYVEEIADALPTYDPSWILEHFRPRGGVRDPLLVTLEHRFRHLLTLPLKPAARAARRYREIEALEERSLSDRRAATAELETLGRELLGSAEAAAGDRALSRGHLADCARFLRAWGAIRLGAAAHAESIDAYVLAYRFACAAGDTTSLGLFFHDASHLLLELEEPGLALRFAEKAVRHFGLRRDRGLVAKALLQASRALAQLGRHQEARLQAIAVLRCSARGQANLRASAWFQLANLAFGRRNHRRALGLLRRAQANARAASLKASIHGRLAIALANLGRKGVAARAFRHAVKLFESSSEQLAGLCLSVDFAEALVLHGHIAEALELVRAMAPRLERLGAAAAACAAWMDLYALIVGGRRDGIREQLQRVREALAEAGGARWLAAGSPWLPFIP